MKVSIIGTVGVPANYGGFETLVEQLILHNRSEDLQYTVYCSKKSYNDERWVYHGARVEYLRWNANGAQSILYDILSLIKATRSSDVILILGVSGCAFLPIYRIFSRKRLVINIDGLEHRRCKWNNWVRRFLKYSEKQAIKYGDAIVSDNQGIMNYLKDEYGRISTLIAYGGDHALQNISALESEEILERYGLKAGEYSLAICRIEPENNVHTILEAFSRMPDKKLVFIGNWKKSAYGLELQQKNMKYENISILSAIYDLRVLNVLRSNCRCYLHGHSAGGTNPSLVEAMFFGVPIFAYDCIYNRESTENKAMYFDCSGSLIDLVNKDRKKWERIGYDMAEIADRRYRWDVIVKQYEQLFPPPPILK